MVTKCVAEVEARGLTTEGIYRLSGFADEIDAIKLALDKGKIRLDLAVIYLFICLFIDGEKADLSMEKYPNVNVITGALKLYLRILPVPLITFEVHPRLIDSIRKCFRLFWCFKIVFRQLYFQSTTTWIYDCLLSNTRYCYCQSLIMILSNL